MDVERKTGRGAWKPVGYDANTKRAQGSGFRSQTTVNSQESLRPENPAAFASYPTERSEARPREGGARAWMMRNRVEVRRVKFEV